MAEVKSALVTGGAGFIGSHLVDRLLKEGHKVSVVDNLSTGKLKNLNSGATFYHVDITHPSVQDIFQREQPDVVFHLAAQISVSESTKDPVNDGEINVIGTLRLLEAVRRSGIEKFIYSSTGGALYGDPVENPCNEQTPIKPLSPYGLSKFLAEQYIELYHRLYHLNYTVLRYGNVYGPRQDPHGEAGVVAIFSQAMLEGKQPRIFGEGDQERDFVYVGDVVDANILAMTRGDGNAFNIGTGRGTNVNRIFDALRDIIKYKWEADHRAARPGEVHQISLDCKKAYDELGWSPQVNLEEGLELTAEFFRKTVRASA
ncbi:MAG TPA: NAD-dependent epimerase/dehydratase family protein [Dehalococcoidia bacterium]|nr:NAD-dependent epimerase/dehydratase family protein [Dehalococcoidia bacterium]